MAYSMIGDAVALKKAGRSKAIVSARVAAQAAIKAKILPLQSRGAADAKAGKYAPPPTAPAPDFDTMNYQAGWLATGAALPSGVVRIGAGGRLVEEESPAGSKTPLIIAAAVAVAAVSFLVLRR